jgi:hypothetical protein
MSNYSFASGIDTKVRMRCHCFMFSDFHSNPFYRPLWIRLAIVGSLAAWTVVEAFVSKSPFWGIIVGALFAFCLWKFLLTYPKHKGD